jgi:hypothetical protein
VVFLGYDNNETSICSRDMFMGLSTLDKIGGYDRDSLPSDRKNAKKLLFTWMSGRL